MMRLQAHNTLQHPMTARGIKQELTPTESITATLLDRISSQIKSLVSRDLCRGVIIVTVHEDQRLSAEIASSPLAIGVIY